jgi:hypothetical protein
MYVETSSRQYTCTNVVSISSLFLHISSTDAFTPITFFFFFFTKPFLLLASHACLKTEHATQKMTGEEKRNSDEGKNNFLKARGKVAHTT